MLDAKLLEFFLCHRKNAVGIVGQLDTMARILDLVAAEIGTSFLGERVKVTAMSDGNLVVFFAANLEDMRRGRLELLVRAAIDHHVEFFPA